MARHLMAVCVVCILCAEHVPCKEHFENLTKTYFEKSMMMIMNSENSSYPKDITNFQTVLGYINKEKNETNNDNNKFIIDLEYNKLSKGRTKSLENYTNDYNNEIIDKRKKRHSTTAINQHNNNNHNEFELYGMKSEHSYYHETSTTTEFLKKLFQQFGNADGRTMSIDGFETMLKRLGLYNLIEEKIPKDETNLFKQHTIHNQQSSNESCISSLELISRISLNKHHNNGHEMNSPDQQKSSKESNTSSSSSEDDEHNYDHRHNDEIINNRADISLDSEDIISLCPILLYQLAAPTSLERSGCINSSLIPNKMYLSVKEEVKKDRLYVWMYALASILGVSLVGLLGVAVIPCMDRHVYQHIIQFLVALAVGTLAGDALLHLLPHSMMMFSSQENGHESMVWKGLVAVLGIIFFFATERGLTMIAEWRKKIEKKEKPSSRVRVMRDPDSTSINNSVAGDKLCKHKYSSYPYCYDEIAMDTKDDHHHHHHQDNSNQKNSSTEKTITPVSTNKNNIHTYHNSNDHGDNNETAQSLLPHNYTTISDSFSVMNKEDGNNPDNNTISTNLDDTSIEGVRDKSLVKEETFTIILREHESSHHGHSHKHGHVHSPPRSLSAVAWMVVMGDGLHNFTDGMAIGAAFSNNIAGGFSTAIAVFCHELPHELGDFAVLLKAGMSAKQAVYYNLLSSVLSFLGMIFGVLIGDTPETSAWIFACAAGMFIYIALVDMMPELTSTHNERCALSQCLLQLLGMSSGLGIMLLVALYEHDLKNLFSTSSKYDNHNHFH